jgi:hypothetical protein
MEAGVQMAIQAGRSAAQPLGRRQSVHRRAPVVIGALLSLSFFGGLQTLLVMARNTVTTFVPFSAQAEVVRPDLTSPPIRTVRSVPHPPTQAAPAATQLSVGLAASVPALVPVPAPAPDPGGGAVPVEVTPKPAPVGPPPPETAPVQPPPPVVVAPGASVTVPVPVTVPPVEVAPVTGGATSKPPKSSIPLSSSSPPSSISVPPPSGAAPPTSSVPPEDD